jgi:hypothetical protein
MGPFHWVVVAVWAVVAGWLVFSIAGAVVKAIFFGDGPVPPPSAAQVLPSDSQPPAPRPAPQPAEAPSR